MRALAVLAIVALLALPASASLIAYEGFAGEAGPLHGTASGFGLTAWDPQSEEPGYQVAGPGLSFGNLVVNGNNAIGGGAYRAAGVGIAMPATWQPDNGWEAYRIQSAGDNRFRAGLDGTTLWASFLLQDFDTNGVQLDFHASHIPWATGGTTVQVRVASGKWAISQASGDVMDTGITRTVGETYLMVVRFDFIDETTDRATLYVNPTPGLAGPDVVGTVLDTSANLELLGVRFYPGNNNNSGAVDEIRFGTSYTAVTPIPEPATLALLGLGGLGLIRRRR